MTYLPTHLQTRIKDNEPQEYEINNRGEAICDHTSYVEACPACNLALWQAETCCDEAEGWRSP